MTTSTEGKLSTADELAARIRVKPTTIYQWARDGRIPAIRITEKVIRFDFQQVLKSLGDDHREVSP